LFVWLHFLDAEIVCSIEKYQPHSPFVTLTTILYTS